MNRFGISGQTTHDWILFGLGRRCSICGLTQMRGEFNDSMPCPGDR